MTEFELALLEHIAHMRTAMAVICGLLGLLSGIILAKR